MKIKIFIVSLVLIGGLCSTLRLLASSTSPEPTCPGSGQECATAADGTIYFKGLDQ